MIYYLRAFTEHWSTKNSGIKPNSGFLNMHVPLTNLSVSHVNESLSRSWL